jgi:hypothetical protein
LCEGKILKFSSHAIRIYPLSGVGLIVEFFEQEEEHDGVHADPPYEGFRVVAFGEEELESVEHDSDELNLREGREEQLVGLNTILSSHKATLLVLLLFDAFVSP